MYEQLEQRLLLSGTAEQQAIELFSVSPALFVENQGQWADESIRYIHSGSGANVALTDSGVVFDLFRQEPTDAATDALSNGLLAEELGTPGRLAPDSYETYSLQFSASFDGANIVTPVGFDKAETVFNYFIGSDESGWREGVASYEVVAYKGLYDGIDLQTWGQRDSLKYEFHVAPGADYQQILISYEGIEALSIDPDGSLVVDLGDEWSNLIDDTPYIYQIIDGEQVKIAGEFKLIDSDTYSFEVTGEYDAGLELIIDPDLTWSTYMGGADWDYGYGIAVDASDGVYVTGETYSSGWASAGFDTSHNGSWDAFVTKLTSSGGHAWSTYMGGSGSDYGLDIAVDASGGVYVTGASGSSGWVSGGYDTSHNGGWDVFVAKLTAAGGHTWSTYMGGSGSDWGGSIAVDASGGVYVTGLTDSLGWVSGGYDTSFNGGTYDVFVAKLTSSGGHTWSTYMGGDSIDNGRAITVDASGGVYVTGLTESSGWVSGGYDTSFNGGWDVFVAKLTSSGGHAWSTYMGGDSIDHGHSIAVDSFGGVYVTGDTTSSGWVSGGFDTSHNGDWDIFVAKLTSSGGHTWSTYMGGSDYDRGQNIAVDSFGGVYVTGDTSSSGWASAGYDTSFNGGRDAFVAKLTSAGDHAWSTYMGGSDLDWGYGIALHASGGVYVTGYTYSPGWASGGFDTSHNGDNDAFVAKIIDIGAAQIDPLNDAIRQGDQDPWFDLNTDSTVDALDRDYLIHNIIGTEYGDSNLDLKVSLADLTILATNYGITSGAMWSQGDSNGDGQVSLADLTILATNYGFDGTAAPAGSSEPVTASIQAEPGMLLSATEYVVTSLADVVASDGVVTLREALEAANTNSAVTADVIAGSDTETDRITFDQAALQAEAGAGNPLTIILGGTQLEITDDVEIVGLGRDILTIDANDTNRVINISGAGTEATLSGLTITGGNTTSSGGGIYIDDGNVTLMNSAVSENIAEDDGGGIFNNIGQITLTNVIVSFNNAEEAGGGIYNEAGTLTLTDITVNENITSFSTGGGIYINSGQVTLTESTVNGNSALYAGSGGGGGIYNNSGQVELMDSTISENSAQEFGGGIYNYGQMTLTNMIVNDNISNQNGGGIFNDGTMTLTDVSVRGNSAFYLGNGGGICIGDNFESSEGHTTLTNVVVTGNSASVYGGGIFFNGDVSVANLTVSGNSAQFGGGIIFYRGSYELVNTAVIGNTASSYGGGIYARGWASLANVAISGNSADIDGGGIYNDGTLMLTNLTVSGNTATSNGGGIYNETGTLTLNNSIVAMNEGGTDDDISGSWDGSNNLIGIDPLFVRNPSAGADGEWGTADDDYGDLQLSTASPAVNAGDDALAVDADDVPLVTDIAGNPRIYGIAVDIGAYENQPTEYIVTSLADVVADDGVVTLREALEAANTNSAVTADVLAGSPTETDRITFNAAALQAEAGPGNPLVIYTNLDIEDDVEIIGPGAGVLTIDANGYGTVVTIDQGEIDVTLVGLKLTGGDGGCAGGIWNRGSGDISLTNMLICDNVGSFAGGIHSEAGHLTLNNVTVAGNSGFSRTGGIYLRDGATLMLNNSIVALNKMVFDRPDADDNIYGDFNGSGNLIGFDPGFVDDAGGDYRLSSTSIAINAGNAALLPADEFDLDGDSDTAEAIPFDVAGNNRISDGVLDIGAFEYQGAPDAARQAPSAVVTTLEDVDIESDGLVSIREAIFYAGVLASPVTFDPSLSGGTIVLGGNELRIFNSVTIDADPVGGITIDADQASRVMHITGSETEVLLKGLTITGGYIPWFNPGTAPPYGGGILNEESTLTLINCSVTANSTGDPGMAAYHGGGIYSWDGNLTVIDSIVSDNYGYYGAAIYNSIGTMTLTNVEVTGNESGIELSSVIRNAGIATLSNVTIFGNIGFGLVNRGFENLPASLTLTNSSVYGNYASAIENINRDSESEMTVTNSIVGRIYNSRSVMTINNSIVWSDEGSNIGDRSGVEGIYSSGELTINNSIVWREGTSVDELINGDWTGGGNHIGVDPMFVRTPNAGAEGIWGTADDDYGDLRLTSASPAVNAGDNSLAVDADDVPLVTDIRGYLRVNGPAVDIGAYEYHTGATEIDSFNAAIAAGAYFTSMDLNSSGSLDQADVDYLVRFNLGSEYGDANLDGKVTLADLTIISTNYGMSSGATWSQGDFNGDGAVSLADMTIIATNFGFPWTPGDANKDGKVGLADLTIISTNFGITSGATWSQGDFNGDGAVSLADMTILATNFGFDGTAAPAGSSEPVTASLQTEPQQATVAISEPYQQVASEPVAPAETTPPLAHSSAKRVAYWQTQQGRQRRNSQRPAMRLLDSKPKHQWLDDSGEDDEIDLLMLPGLQVL